MPPPAESHTMDELFEVRHVSVSIQRSPQAVYEFVSDGRHLPRWASGLGASVQASGSDWLADGPLGRIRIRFAAPNQFGVLDHDVQLPSGDTVRNPLRVVANGTGSELTFTLFRLRGVDEPTFAADAATVERDLNRLKELLEA
jgi:hypothetical protein